MPNPHAPNSPWTEGRVAILRRLWFRTAPDGQPLLSEAAIGRVLGMTKHQVHSKAKRLDLPGRDTPKERGSLSETARAQAAKHSAQRAGMVTLPPLPSLLEAECS